MASQEATGTAKSLELDWEYIKRRILGYAQWMCGSYDRDFGPEDVFQEASQKIEKDPKVREDPSIAKMRSYLYKVTRSSYVDLWRRNRHQRGEPPNAQPEAAATPFGLEKKNEEPRTRDPFDGYAAGLLIRDFVKTLSPKELALVDCMGQELTNNLDINNIQIGNQLGISEGTVRNHRRLLSAKLKEFTAKKPHK